MLCAVNADSAVCTCGHALPEVDDCGHSKAEMMLIRCPMLPELACRCLKSCQDVAVACQSDLSNGMLACTIYLAQQPTGLETGQLISSCMSTFLSSGIDDDFANMSPPAQAAANADCAIHSPDGSNHCAAAALAATDESESVDQSGDSSMTADADIVDDYLKPPVMHRHWQPLVLAVGVPALPKGALVEVQPMACTVDALTAQQAADTSSDEEVDSQQGGNHLSSWASRLVNRVGSIEGDSAGRWSSLTSQGVYCCCQVELVVCKDSLDTVMGHVVHMLSSLLAGASLTAQNVVSLTAYAQVSSTIPSSQVRSSFHAVWKAQHTHELPFMVVPVWSVVPMTGTGADLQTQADSKTHICFRLVAHRYST